MRILVSVVGRHGTTRSLGRELEREFLGAGADVDVREPDSVLEVGQYDVIVIGSAVYSGRWMPAVNELVARLANVPHPRIWLFSCGPMHSIDRPVNNTTDAARAMSSVGAVEHRTFPGRLNAAQLSYGERHVFDTSGAEEGDFRDWAQVRRWARRILASAGPASDRALPSVRRC